MSFLNPLMLWGALGAAVPVIIHLWGRRRPRRVLFPSLRLIRAGQQRQHSFARLRELLVMLLRMLLIAVVSLALARPVAESPLLASLSPPDQQAVVLVDTSASMAYRHGKETSLERARRAARTIASRLPAGFSTTFFTVGSELRRVGTDLDALQGLRTGYARGRILGLLNEAVEAEITDPRSRLFLLTDLQESSLRGELVRPLPQPPIVVDVGAASPRNHAIADVVTRSSCPLRGRPLELDVVVEAWGKQSGSKALSVIGTAGGRDMPGRTVAASPGRRRTRLRAEPHMAGDLEVVVSLPADNLPSDDTYYCIERVRERLTATVIAGRSDAKLIALALNPGGDVDTGIDVSALDWDSAPRRLPTSDLLILTDTPGGSRLVNGAVDFVRRGGGVILFTGPDTEMADEVLAALLGAPVRLGGVVAAPRDDPLLISELNTSRPPLEVFANPRAGNLLEFRFTHRRMIENAEAARVLARFSDGGPAILGTLDPDRHFLLINTSLDDRWTNAPFLSGYVPLIHRVCYDVVGPLPRVWLEGFVGQALRADMPEGASGAAEITEPDGEKAKVQPVGRRWVFTPRLRGIHHVTWREGGRELTARFGANVSPAESDLTRISPAELKRRLRALDAVVLREGELASYLEQARLARADLTRPLLMLALLILVIETFLTAPRQRSSESEEFIE